MSLLNDESGRAIDLLKKYATIRATTIIPIRIYPEMITYQGIIYKYNYDEFLYHFFAALHGSYPSGKPLEEDTDKKYTFADAYEYARLNDVWNPLHPDHEEVCKIVSLPSAIEIPQMQVFM